MQIKRVNKQQLPHNWQTALCLMLDQWSRTTAAPNCTSTHKSFL